MGKMWLGPKKDVGAVTQPIVASNEVLATPSLDVPAKVVEVVKEVEKLVQVEKEVVKEVRVEVPVYVDRFVDRIVERIEEVPVIKEVVKEVIKEVRVEVPVEKVVKIPVHVNHNVTPKWVDFVFWGLIIKYAATAIWLAVK